MLETIFEIIVFLVVAFFTIVYWVLYLFIYIIIWKIIILGTLGAIAAIISLDIPWPVKVSGIICAIAIGTSIFQQGDS